MKAVTDCNFLAELKKDHYGMNRAIKTTAVMRFQLKRNRYVPESQNIALVANSGYKDGRQYDGTLPRSGQNC